MNGATHRRSFVLGGLGLSVGIVVGAFLLGFACGALVNSLLVIKP
ncbi:MAG: hypothetical protein FLDDKLPJ_01186 [Phycisphaerae bacterium]|nr:hypothetical protein [Phycisphaerae bacterium]